MKEIKAVFLDIDNTILDFDAYVKQALRAGFEKFDLGTYTEQTYENFEIENRKVWKELEEGKITFAYLEQVRMQRFFDAYDIAMNGVVFEKYFRSYLRESAIPVKGIETLLPYLAEKYMLFTASNGPYEQQVHRIDLAGYSHYFRDHFISEDIGLSKPAIGFFQAAMERMKQQGIAIKPKEIVIIGDSLSSDMTGGYYAGLHTIWYNPTQQANNSKIPVDEEVQDLLQITHLL